MHRLIIVIMILLNIFNYGCNKIITNKERIIVGQKIIRSKNSLTIEKYQERIQEKTKND